MDMPTTTEALRSTKRAKIRKKRTEGYYTYGVIKLDPEAVGKNGRIHFGPIGIGDRGDEVFTVGFQDLGMVVSMSPIKVYDPNAKNSMTHNRVIETIVDTEGHPMVPASFGTILKREQDVIDLLEDAYDELKRTLRKLGTMREVSVKVIWRNDALQKTLNRHPDLAALRKQVLRQRAEGTGKSTVPLRFHLGQQVQRRMISEGDRIARDIYTHLEAVARAAHTSDLIHSRMLLNASFLVDVEKQDQFQKRLDLMDDRYGDRVRWMFTGDFAPYNFVNVRLEALAGTRRRKKKRVYV